MKVSGCYGLKTVQWIQSDFQIEKKNVNISHQNLSKKTASILVNFPELSDNVLMEISW